MNSKEWWFWFNKVPVAFFSPYDGTEKNESINFMDRKSEYILDIYEHQIASAISGENTEFAPEQTNRNW